MKIDLNKITPLQKLVIAKGLLDYQYIMDNWKKNDSDFQEVYYGFYLKARWGVASNNCFKEKYFQKLKKISPEENIINIIMDLHEDLKSKSYEFSLVSKMLHTRNPLEPIYDSKIREYLSKEEEVELWWQISNKKSGADRGTGALKKIEHDWENLCRWYKDFLPSDRGKLWVDWFDCNFPDYKGISDIKKIDFIIFATN